MHRLKLGLVVFAALLVITVVGCGKQTVTLAPPAILSTTPANGTIGLPLNQPVSATFNEGMNPATITASTFTLTGPGGTAVASAVTYVSATNTAVLTPNVNLMNNAVYTATVTTGASDPIGDGLAANYVWSFTTATQPTVVATTPVNGATGVPITQVVSASFSKPMNPATLNSSTFTLASAGGGSVTGFVTYNAAGSVASFTPAANLADNTTYTATITSGATDTTGAPLNLNYVWTFTTATRPTVLSTVPSNGATGVALNQVITATFSKAMNPASLNASTFTLTSPTGGAVTGMIAYTANGSVASFTPSAALLPNTYYTASLTTGVSDTDGNVLAANYVWKFRTVPASAQPTVIATTPVNGATGVAVNQGLSATFSTAMNGATVNSTSFTLKVTGGAAVTGSVGYVPAGSVAVFTPAANLATSTSYTATITTGAQDLAGTALAANYSWTFTTAAVGNTSHPTVVATIPMNGATNVPRNEVVEATFSTAMNAGSINSKTFTLTGPGAIAVAGQIAHASVGNTATFTPDVNLAANTLFTATITTGATDLSGNALAANYVWTFTTGVATNTTKPEIVSTSPANFATGVTLNTVVSATFSAAMNPLTITTGTFQLTAPGAVPVAGIVSYDPLNFVASFTPSAPLTANTSYIATITSGATDTSGNSLGITGSPNPWTFTTGTLVVVPPINLGSAIFFGGFGGNAGMTNQGIKTVVNGNIGTTAASTLVTGFHDNTPNCIYTETPLNVGLVNGTIDTAPPPPSEFCSSEGTAVTMAVAEQAAADALAAYNALVAFPNGLDVSGCCGGGNAGELGNRTLAPGTYKAAPGTYGITEGDLTLDAKHDANAIWVFQMAKSLTVGTPTFHRNVLLTNGALAKNVFWQVGSAATINGVLGGGTMQGTIIAQAGISVSTAGVVDITTVNGRLLSLTGSVTIVNTVINTP